MSKPLARRLAALEGTSPTPATDMEAWWRNIGAMLAGMPEWNRAYALVEVPRDLARLTRRPALEWHSAIEAVAAAHIAAATASDCDLNQ
ncbi:MAG: hypothetical protein ACOYOH_28725 [Paracraurococcus sp.]